jgi:hypothetical protein
MLCRLRAGGKKEEKGDRGSRRKRGRRKKRGKKKSWGLNSNVLTSQSGRSKITDVG